MHTKEDLKKIIDLFIRGWVYCRCGPSTKLYYSESMTHVDFGRNVRGRSHEFFIWNLNSGKVMDRIKEKMDSSDHWATVFSDTRPADDEVMDYKQTSSEFLMTLDLQQMDSLQTEDQRIKRVRTIGEAQSINQFFDNGVVELNRLDDLHLHYYFIEEDGHPACYGSYSLLDQTVCLDKIFTAEAHRGKGMAKELCRKMLFDAKQEGAAQGVLISSQMGHPVYLKLGYQDFTNIWTYSKKSTA